MQRFMRFCAFGLAATLCACANDYQRSVPGPMFRPDIGLEIQAISAPTPGYLTTYGSNGKMYGYRYSGGDDNGDIHVKHSEGRIDVQVVLTAGSSFAIDDVQFIPPDDQLSFSKENATRGRIHDENSGPLKAYYSVKVSDSGVAIYCDPRIVNN